MKNKQLFRYVKFSLNLTTKLFFSRRNHIWRQHNDCDISSSSFVILRNLLIPLCTQPQSLLYGNWPWQTPLDLVQTYRYHYIVQNSIQFYSLISPAATSRSNSCHNTSKTTWQNITPKVNHNKVYWKHKHHTFKRVDIFYFQLSCLVQALGSMFNGISDRWFPASCSSH